ncbi:O-fucosyltransferase family protein [Winogradskyella ursingii]|uniref:hypothetical protein n=1 Tax=Winogradskyella ursingii TaxID=2686079 RepID=UPI0015C72FC0|nr:hypothetical protein [Winogradskyella ursingii]
MSQNPKYLYYQSAKRFGEGLLDRRSCLMILLAEAKLSGRTAVLPKFVLGAQHNQGSLVESYLIDEYLSIDNLNVPYILEENFFKIYNDVDTNDVLKINDHPFNYDSPVKIVIRILATDNFWNLKKTYDTFKLAKLYHGVGVKFVIPMVEAPVKVKRIGDEILNSLERPTIGLHLRRGDRLNKKLRESMSQSIIIKKMKDFDYNSVFYCTNDKNYKIDQTKFHSHHEFSHLLESITDNYLLFAIEMYVVDNCDISIRTFNDSSPFYNIKDTTEKNYAISNYSMHSSSNRFKKIPLRFVKCYYEDITTDKRKAFVRRRPFLPLLIKVIKWKLKLM